MDGLLEFCFERIGKKEISPLVKFLAISRENIVDVKDTMSDEFTMSDIFDEKYWCRQLPTAENILYINLKRILIDNIYVENCSMLIMANGDSFDFSILLSSNDCKKSGIVNAQIFFNWASEISQKFGIVNFFGGLDPAEDIDTQLYTINGIGSNVEI